MTEALERQRERFEADPTQTSSFAALEEAYFFEGDWPALVALYRLRLSARDLAERPDARGRLLYRLAQVLEERCQDREQALATYQEAAQLAPRFAPTLRRLREIYRDQAQWELVVQVAELEAETQLPPAERAALCAETGEIWLDRLGDPELALSHFDRAVGEDPGCAPALRGRARALERLSRPDDAAETWRLLTRGGEPGLRAEAFLALGRLLDGPLGRPDEAYELLRRAHTEDPTHAEALEALAEAATARGDWERATDLGARRFDLAAGARLRSLIAIGIADIELAQRGDARAARLWLERARELTPDEPDVLLRLADVARARDDGALLCECLDAALEALGDRSPVGLLREAAQLHIDRGDDAAAANLLRRALDRGGDAGVVLDALLEVYQRLGRHEELVDLLEARADGATGSQRAAALTQLGALHEERLGDPESALDAQRRAFAADPATPGVALALDRLLRKAESWMELEELLRAARHAAPERERPALLCSLGELVSGQLTGETLEPDAPAAEVAREAFEEALGLEPAAPRALHGLERLAAASGDGDAILRAYAREAEVTRERDRRIFLLWELARLCEAQDRLDETADWLLRLRRDLPQDPDAAAGLVAIQTRREDDAGRCEALEHHASLLHGAARAAVLCTLAEHHAARDREPLAVAAWLGALEADPGDVAAMTALLEPLERGGRLQELVRVRRSLAEHLPPAERAACLSVLAHLLADRLEDPDAAVVVLWRLVEDPDAPADVDERLERALERTGRFEELAQRLAERRHTSEPGSPEARELDLRRAEVLSRELGHLEEAAELYREVLGALDPGETGYREQRAALLDALEGVVRRASDVEGLVGVLAERAADCPDPERRAAMDLERAGLLEEDLARPGEARVLLEGLVAEATSHAETARERLARVLERTGDLPALRALLEAAVEGTRAGGDRAAHLALRERVADLCQHRLGDSDGAVTHLEAIVAEQRARVDVWQRLQGLHEAAGRTGSLLEALEGELAAEPGPERELPLRVRAGALCEESGDEAGACRHHERALALDPGHPAPVAFLAGRYTREDRIPELVDLLRGRLARLEAPGGDPDRAAGLRLRLAGLQAERLDDLDAAIGSLEPAVLGEAAAFRNEAARPLADLYTRACRQASLRALAERAVQAPLDAAERADWQLTLAGTLRAAEEPEAAAAAYREVLALRPDDAEAERGLCEIHRERGEAAPLARLLEAILPRLAGAAEVPVRMELAGLLETALDRARDALPHLRRVLELEPDHAEALDAGLRVASGCGDGPALLELLDGALARPLDPSRRGALLRRRGEVLAGPLDRPADAAACFREGLALDPSQDATRACLRASLERLGDWAGVLDVLHATCRRAPAAERVELLEEGARLAERELAPEAALPWLERLRAERPEDAGVHARIAEIHRAAGRTESLLRTLDAQAACADDPAQRRAVHLERARLLEPDSSARALAALEAARGEGPEDPEILAELDRLYTEAGRPRERVAVVEARIAAAPAGERGALHRTAAELYLDALGEPEPAGRHLEAALALGSGPRVALLQARSRALRAAGRATAWVEAAEQELAALDRDEPVFRERRLELQADLARVHAGLLADGDTALRHLRAVVDAPAPDEDDEVARRRVAAAETELLQRLDREGCHGELARRLAARLERVSDDTEGWLALARLREERLHEPAAAADAYRAVIARRPGHLDALQGLRRVAERLGRWETVADTLDRELAVLPEADRHARASRLRRLGEVSWQRLQETTRASRAYAGALEAVPDDLDSLRALQALFEIVEDWRGALDLYDSELDLLGDTDPERTRGVLLRVAELAADRSDEPRRAVAALEAADRLAALEAPPLRALADLLHGLGRNEAFAATLTRWCDHPAARPGIEDHLVLADTLRGNGRLRDAAARLERAVTQAPEHPLPHRRLAALREELGERDAAAEAWASAAAVDEDAGAAEALVRASDLVEERDPERAVSWLASAVARDPAAAEAHARLARVCHALGRLLEAERAAGHALDLAGAGGALDDDLRLEVALLGAKTARERGELESAARFATTARALAPDSAAVLAMEAEVLFAMGEIDGARRALEARLARADDDDASTRGVYTRLLGQTLEQAGDLEGALARYREAASLAPGDDEAAAGALRLLERTGRLEEAQAALLERAERCRSDRERADHLCRAAELELARGGDETAAEAHLRAALEAVPGHPAAALLLTTRLAESDREQEALEQARAALDRDAEPDVHARLALLVARILEKSGERAEAARIYGRAAEADPRCASAALSQARILRSLGEWREAADRLAAFADRHPGDEPAALAQIHFHRGRLLAGPLEEVDEALEAYRSAVGLNPRLRDGHEALARLLAHRPECWDEALARHRELLESTPWRAASLRDAIAIARGRERDASASAGLAILRALGAAGPAEREQAPERLPLRVGEPARLENPVWEAVRRVATAAADEMARALGATPAPPASGAESDPAAAFRAAALEAEAALAAPALVPLADEELAETLRMVVDLALEQDHLHGDGHRVNALAHELGRWARRRVKRELGDVRPEDVADVDFGAWRAELRSLAHATALDALGGGLRSALLALLDTGPDGAPCRPGPEADLTDLVASSPTAGALLRRVVVAWLSELQSA